MTLKTLGLPPARLQPDWIKATIILTAFGLLAFGLVLTTEVHKAWWGPSYKMASLLTQQVTQWPLLALLCAFLAGHFMPRLVRRPWLAAALALVCPGVAVRWRHGTIRTRGPAMSGPNLPRRSVSDPMNTSLNQCQTPCFRYRSLWLLGPLLCLSYPLTASEGQAAPTPTTLATHYRAAQGPALAELGDARAVAPLIAHLDDENAFVRAGIAFARAELGDGHAVEPLIVPLDDAAAVRVQASVFLNQLDDVRKVEPLILRLEDPAEDARARGWVASALGKLRDGRALDPLIRLSAAEVEFRAKVVEALGRLGDPRAVETLVALLGDQGADIRGSAASALGAIGDPRAVAPLIALLADKEAAVRTAAIWALGQLGDPRASEPLLRRLEDAQEDPEVRWAATMALSTLGDSRAARALVENLFHRPQEAAAALGRLGFSSPAITAALIDTHYRALLPALVTAPAYDPNLLRLVHDHRGQQRPCPPDLGLAGVPCPWHPS